MKLSDEEYKKFLEQRLEAINKELTSIKKQQEDLNNASVAITRRINGLAIEQQIVSEQIRNYTGRMVARPDSHREHRIENVDEKYEKTSTKQQAYDQKIQEMRNLQNTTSSKYMKNKIERKIQKLQPKLEKLKTKQAKLKGKQRKLMYPKYRRQQIKQTLLSRQQGRVMTFQERARTNAQLSAMMSDKKAFGSFQANIAAIKANHYHRRMLRSQEVLNKMQSKGSVIGMRGANITTLPKRALHTIRDLRSGLKVATPGAPAMSM